MALYRKYLKKCKTELSKCLQDIYNTETDIYDNINSRLDSLDFYLYYFNEHYKQILKPLILKTNEHYCIIKEQFTEIVFFVSKDLIVFYIKPQDYEDFYLSFVYSENYKMLIYKTKEYYIAFCISHTSRDICNIKRFLLMNNNDIRLTILSYFINETKNDKSDNVNEMIYYNDEIVKHMIYPNDLEYRGIVILNKDIFSYLDKKQYKLYFDSIIGYGEEKPELVDLVNVIKMYIDNNTYMPPHFLNFF